MIRDSRHRYINDYIDTPEINESDEKMLLDHLFYDSQYKFQSNELKTNKLYKSDSKYFNIKNNDIAMPIYDKLGCKPRINLTPPSGKRFTVFLSHDVDLIYPSKKYYAMSAALKLLYKFRTGNELTKSCKSNNPYNTFEKIINIEKRYNANSTFFFLSSGKESDPYNYDINDCADYLGAVIDSGCEVGLHGGYSTWNDPYKVESEKKKLEDITGIDAIGYRNHCLRFHIPNTWKILSQKGFDYDSTFAYNDLIGFRNGLCFPFKPYDIENENVIDLIEIPLNIMDITLLGYNKFGFNEALSHCLRMIDAVKKYGGIIGLNWHTNYFDGICWKEYELLYEEILKYCFMNNAWMCSGNRILDRYGGM